MGLWGASDSDEAKPKNLSEANTAGTYNKKEVLAANSGWVQKAGTAASGNDNASAQPEVLVAIGGLAEALGGATISSVQIVNSELDQSEGFQISVNVIYNENVTVTGSPLMIVENSKAGGGSASNQTLTMNAGGSTTNKLNFTGPSVAGGGSTIVADDVISIPAQTIDLNGGTMKDTANTSVNAERVISAAVSAAANTITVIA